MQIVRDWNEFWFTPKSPGSLGLFRILLGIVFLLWALLSAPPNLQTWYTERGVMPLSFYRMYRGSNLEISVLDSVTNPHVLYAAWIVLIVLAFFFMIGFFTRTSTALLCIMFLSFNNRDPLILNSGDSMLRCLSFLMLLAPCGASCSVDRMIAIARGRDKGGAPAPLELWAQRLIQCQVALLYAATVVSKLNGRDWLDGTAVYYPLHMDELTRFPLPSFLYSPMMTNVLTWGTLVTESSLATLIFVPRARPYVLTMGILLHSGIELALNIPLFSMIMISSYMNFVRVEWLEAWQGALSRSFARYRLIVELPAGIGPESTWRLVVDRLDVLRLLQLTTGVDGNSANLRVTGRGWEADGPEAMRRVVLALPALWPFFLIFLIPGSSSLLTPFMPHPLLQKSYSEEQIASPL